MSQIVFTEQTLPLTLSDFVLAWTDELRMFFQVEQKGASTNNGEVRCPSQFGVREQKTPC